MKVTIVSPYLFAKIQRLASEAGLTVDEFATRIFVAQLDAAVARAKKGNTYPRHSKNRPKVSFLPGRVIHT